MKNKTELTDETANIGKVVLPAVNFQFLYRKKRNQEYAQEFYSKKKTINEAMDDFLTRKRNLYDIDEEVKVTYENAAKKLISVDVRQDYDMSWYFVFENKMICGNDYSCPFNGK
jgi:hypothetical protein